MKKDRESNIRRTKKGNKKDKFNKFGKTTAKSIRIKDKNLELAKERKITDTYNYSYADDCMESSF